MATGLEALGAASAVLQVISFASDLAVACKKAYDGAKTPQDDLERHAKQMAEVVGRVQTRCEDMAKSNSNFNAPELRNIAKVCKDAAEDLELEVQSVTKLQAKGSLVKAFRKAFNTSRHQKKLQGLEESLSRYQQLMETELTLHLCSRSDAISLQQEVGFQKLEIDIQSLITQLAEGYTSMENLIKQEHITTRDSIVQETAKTGDAINAHTTTQVMELRTGAEIKTRCESFLQSLKSPSMNRRYNEVMDSRDASFKQVFASYENMKTADYYYEGSEDAEDDDDPDGSESFETVSNSDEMSDMADIDRSWASFVTWLQSSDTLFYIQGKPGSGKSTFIKFILDQDLTHQLIRHWSADATIISHFFWKIGSYEQNSIKGLWCSLLYQRLQGQQELIRDTLERFKHLSLHTSYHDWSLRDLEAVWTHVANMDTRHLCILIDGLDEIRNEDGFSQLSKSMQLISKLPKTKLCVSTRPEAQIMRWISVTNAPGIRLEDLTRFDMLRFVRQKFHNLLPNDSISAEEYDTLTQDLAARARGVFLWLHLATRNIIEGIENADPAEMLFARLRELPEDLEKLYSNMWQRLSPVYRETAARYFRYALQSPSFVHYASGDNGWISILTPSTFQIACAEDSQIQATLLPALDTIDAARVQQMCDAAKTSIRIRCAGLLEIQPRDRQHATPFPADKRRILSDAVGRVVFIHRTAHDFLTDTEVGQSILGCGSLTDFDSETRLIKGLICLVVVFSEKWGLIVNNQIITEIVKYSKRWGNEGLQVAIEMLDILRPLYDKQFITMYHDPRMPQIPFFNHLIPSRQWGSLQIPDSISNAQLDDYFISRLTTENSTSLATSVLCHAWYPNADPSVLSPRLFNALLSLGADPHDYRLSKDIIPFLMKGTALSNLLMTFLAYTQPLLRIPWFMEREHEILTPQTPYEVFEMAMRMAQTCKDFNTSFVFLGSFTESGNLGIFPLSLPKSITNTSILRGQNYVFYEVNMQFLLLYLISKVSGYLAKNFLLSPEAQRLPSRLNSPSVKIRVFVTSEPSEDLTGSTSETTTERETAPSLVCQRIPSHLSALSINDIEHLFGVEFKGRARESRAPNQCQTGLDIVIRHIENLDIEEVDYESAVVGLAKERLGFVSYEEEGIVPDIKTLRRDRNMGLWKLFPLMMGRLEEAATEKEKGT
ncbi:hypothetical protein F53441_10686 [Fusarium austroafricanum]|uniref:NACHT domain-containing protein n=1 Tax=Fusarium austroafricanum TaxID=2364996 RepID=A0A8H4P205_9HYPO|nr:hypothetical protein F53441_10686 [Fusarium austroafricanum]